MREQEELPLTNISHKSEEEEDYEKEEGSEYDCRSEEMSVVEKLEKAIKNRPTHDWMIDNLDKLEDIESAFRKIENAFADFQENHVIVPRKKLESERLRLNTQRRRTLKSISDFFVRLPKIMDAKIAMAEFQAHNTELIDYIIELEGIWNMTFDEEIKQLITNRPKLAPPEYRWRKYKDEIR